MRAYIPYHTITDAFVNTYIYIMLIVPRAFLLGSRRGTTPFGDPTTWIWTCKLRHACARALGGPPI